MGLIDARERESIGLEYKAGFSAQKGVIEDWILSNRGHITEGGGRDGKQNKSKSAYW